MKKLSLEPYKGTRDFYPEDQFAQNYIFSVMKRVVERYGYLEYGSTILEETDLYRAKTGEEIVNEQTYSFTDRGGRDVTIRPEMTPTVARMVAQRRKELTFPLRWYSIPNLFRYERPQRGRLREHWQLNCDLFGVEGVDADVEVIAMASDIMKAYGANPDRFEVRLNDRRLMNFLLQRHLGLSADECHRTSKLVDRMHKMSGEEFTAAVTEVVREKSGELTALLRIRSLEDLRKKVPAAPVQELASALAKLAGLGISNAVYDPALTRGFDYYTGIVFEVFDTGPENNRSLFGGGRYDDLVGIFGVEKVPGVGFGMGDVTIRDYLETYGLLPQYQSSTDIYVVPFDSSFTDFCNSLAADLRRQGVSVAVDLTDRKLAAKVKAADRAKIPWVLVVGEEERRTGVFRLKNLAESRECSVPRADIAAAIAKQQ